MDAHHTTNLLGSEAVRERRLFRVELCVFEGHSQSHLHRGATIQAWRDEDQHEDGDIQLWPFPASMNMRSDRCVAGGSYAE